MTSPNPSRGPGRATIHGHGKPMIWCEPCQKTLHRVSWSRHEASPTHARKSRAIQEARRRAKLTTTSTVRSLDRLLSSTINPYNAANQPHITPINDTVGTSSGPAPSTNATEDQRSHGTDVAQPPAPMATDPLPHSTPAWPHVWI